MLHKQRKLSAVAILVTASASLLGTAPSVQAAAIAFSITGTGSDGPLAATAQFTTSPGQIQVTLSNDLTADVIRSAGQAVSDLTFTLSNDAGTLGATSASGQLGNVSGKPSLGLVTYVSGSPTRWLGAGGQGDFSVVGSVVTLEAIGGGQPDQMIAPLIANGETYSNVNNGFRNFSPYVIGPATFTLDLSGVTADTTVTSVTFSFGTGPDTLLSQTCTLGCTPTPPSTPALTLASVPQLPEPASLVLLGTALVGLGLLQRRKA